MTLTTTERIHSLVTFHLDNRIEQKAEPWANSAPKLDLIHPARLLSRCAVGSPLAAGSPPFQPKPAAGGRDFSSVAVPVWCIAARCAVSLVYCGTLHRNHCTCATPLHLHRHRLQCGSDRRPTKMLTRALVRASRALPGILTRAHATYEGAACRRKALRST